MLLFYVFFEILTRNQMRNNNKLDGSNSSGQHWERMCMVSEYMLIRTVAGFWNEAVMVARVGNHSDLPLNKNDV